jgi:hypothetical protein
VRARERESERESARERERERERARERERERERAREKERESEREREHGGAHVLYIGIDLQEAQEAMCVRCEYEKEDTMHRRRRRIPSGI